VSFANKNPKLQAWKMTKLSSWVDRNVIIEIRYSMTSKRIWSGYWWLTPIILATQEAEIRRLTFQSQPGKTVFFFFFFF
jgi:hypothetical protein